MDVSPHLIFARIVFQPNRSNLMELHKNLCDNAAYVNSNLRGGNYGLLAILIKSQDYHAQMGHAFIAPTNPGNYPNCLDHGTEQQSKMIERTKNQERLLFE